MNLEIYVETLFDDRLSVETIKSTAKRFIEHLYHNNYIHQESVEIKTNGFTIYNRCIDKEQNQYMAKIKNIQKDKYINITYTLTNLYRIEDVTIHIFV